MESAHMNEKYEYPPRHWDIMSVNVDHELGFLGSAAPRRAATVVKFVNLDLQVSGLTTPQSYRKQFVLSLIKNMPKDELQEITDLLNSSSL